MENLIKQDQQAFNRAAEACTAHRMRQVSMERFLVNPKYDNETDEPSNVSFFRYTMKCSGPCGQIAVFDFKPEKK